MSSEQSPQLEDGHTRIANELLDAIIAFDFSKRQQKVVLQVIRKTYGFNKKMDDMTVSQIARSCGLQRPHASSTISELVAMNVLLKSDGNYGYVLGVNKSYSQWTPYRNGTCTETVITPYRNSHLTVPKQYTQKTLSKDTIKRHSNFDIPEWVPTTEWDAFVEYRVKIKKPLTSYAMKLAIKKLGEIVDTGHNAIDVINEAILKGWLSFYPPKNNVNAMSSIMDGVS